MAEENKLQYNSENIKLKVLLTVNQIIHEESLYPPVWLDEMESPFKWAQALQRSLMYFLMHRKLHDYKNQGAFYGFEKFGILLVIIFKRVLLDLLEGSDESSQKEKESDEIEEEGRPNVEEKLNDNVENEDDEKDEFDYELEEALAKCEETILEMAANEGDVMYSRIGPVFHHVYLATKAHILYLQGEMEESKELARNIQPLEGMSVQCKAGIEGLKVKFIMSLYQDYTILLPLLSKAVELDPKFGYWHYLTGKVIRRLRRDFNEKMVKAELEYFEKAVELERNPKFLVFLAQAYQEMAKILISTEDASVKDTAFDFLQNAVDLFRECWCLKNDSAPISQRVGNGMLKMKAGFIDKGLAKAALLKSIELSPKHGSHLALGKYYYYHEQNDEKALECFEKDAPSSFASPEIIRLNLIKNPDYDPYDVLQAWSKHDQGTLKKQSAYCDFGWYYLIYKKDLKKSVKYFWKVLQMDYKSFKVLGYKSYGFCVEDPINMVEVLVNEILLLKERNESLAPKDRKHLSKFFNSFLEKILEKHPDLCNIAPKHNLLNELKEKSERTISEKRRYRYKPNLKNREPVRREEPGSWRNRHPSQSLENNNHEPSQQEGDNKRWRNKYPQSLENDNQEPIEGDNRRYQNNVRGTSNMHSFSTSSEERRSRGYGGDGRRNSESQRDWSTPRSSNNSQETNRRFNNSGERQRQSSSYNNSRYDVTITDWRSENRRQ